MNISVINAGLTGIQSTLVKDWIGPAFLIMIAGLALKLMLDRSFRSAAMFAGIAVVVGLFIYAGDSLFGSSGNLTTVAKNKSKEINVIDLNHLVAAVKLFVIR